MAYAKLDESMVLACLARHAGGESYAAIAADYGVSKVTVWNAVNGRSWRHLTGLAPPGGAVPGERLTLTRFKG
jgi:hypothetical protein